MQEVLITLGCSFTYGQGLEFNLWKDKYPSTFEKFKNNKEHEPYDTVVTLTKEFEKYREAHRYSEILANLTNLELVTKATNGGNNLDNIQSLDKLIQYYGSVDDVVPKYCVFQFTNVTRDINAILVKGRYVDEIFSKELISKIRTSKVLGTSLREYSELFENVFDEILIQLTIRFKKLEEKHNTKCVFFIGLSSTDELNDKLNTNEYHIPLIYDNTQYASWDRLNKLNNWTLRDDINVNDEHPSIDSHNWMAETLTTRYLYKTN